MLARLYSTLLRPDPVYSPYPSGLITLHLAESLAESLDLLDELIMLEIYPARELPIKGVSSQMILSGMKKNNYTSCTKKTLMKVLANKNFEVLLTLGAGDIDTFVGPIRELVSKKDKPGI